MGGTNVFRHGAVTSIADLCRADEVTCLDISRMHAADLVRQAAGPGVLLGGIKLRTGGSAVPADLRAELQQRVTPLLFVRYAATECGAIAICSALASSIPEPRGPQSLRTVLTSTVVVDNNVVQCCSGNPF